MEVITPSTICGEKFFGFPLWVRIEMPLMKFEQFVFEFTQKVNGYKQAVKRGFAPTMHPLPSCITENMELEFVSYMNEDGDDEDELRLLVDTAWKEQKYARQLYLANSIEELLRSTVDKVSNAEGVKGTILDALGTVSQLRDTFRPN